MKDEGSQLQHLYHKLSHLDAHLGVCNKMFSSKKSNKYWTALKLV